MNLIPLPYRRVSVQQVHFELNERHLKAYLKDKDVYKATDFIIFRNGPQSAIVQVTRQESEDLFHRVLSIDVVAETDLCVFVKDPSVDTSSRSALASKAHVLSIRKDQTLIVEGAFGHVNFIHQPQPILLQVTDLVPPSPSRLMDLVEKALMLHDLGPVVPIADLIDINQISCKSKSTSVLFPCAASGLTSNRDVYFLDEHPVKRDWDLIGCERSEQIYRHFYKENPKRIETCPLKIKKENGQAYSIVRCCMFESHFEVKGKRAIVPWGSDINIVASALSKVLV